MPRGIKRTDNKKVCDTCGEQDIDKFSYAGSLKTSKRYLRNKCDPCRVKQAYRRRNPAYKAESYECANDYYGLYTIGATLFHGEMMDLLEAGYLPPGSEWIDRLQGKRWTVKGNELWYLLHECLNDRERMPKDVVMESQRLVERQPPGDG